MMFESKDAWFRFRAGLPPTVPVAAVAPTEPAMPPTFRPGVLREGDAVSLIAAQALKCQRALDDTTNDTMILESSARLTTIGQLVGLRVALCILHGWDPAEHADKEGRADDLVQEYWRTHPGEGDACRPSFHFTPHVGCVLR